MREGAQFENLPYLLPHELELILMKSLFSFIQASRTLIFLEFSVEIFYFAGSEIPKFSNSVLKFDAIFKIL